MATDAIKTMIDSHPDPFELDCLAELERTWTEDEYLALDTNRLVEYVDGRIEVLPMPTFLHQLVLLFLYKRMDGIRPVKHTSSSYRRGTAPPRR